MGTVCLRAICFLSVNPHPHPMWKLLSCHLREEETRWLVVRAHTLINCGVRIWTHVQIPNPFEHGFKFQIFLLNCPHSQANIHVRMHACPSVQTQDHQIHIRMLTIHIRVCTVFEHTYVHTKWPPAHTHIHICTYTCTYAHTCLQDSHKHMTHTAKRTHIACAHIHRHTHLGYPKNMHSALSVLPSHL